MSVKTMTKRPVVQRKGELPRKYLPQFINILKKLCKLVLLQCYIFFFSSLFRGGGGASLFIRCLSQMKSCHSLNVIKAQRPNPCLEILCRK